MLLFGGWASYLSAQQERVDTRNEVLSKVGDVTEWVASELVKNLEAAEALAISTALDDGDLQAFYREAQRLKAMHPLWHTVELADPSGNQLLNLLRPLGTPLGATAERQSFDKVVRTRQPAVSGIGPIGPVSGLQLVALRVPVIRNDELLYVLSVALVPNGVSSLLRNAGLPPGWIGAVLDAKGNYVARTLAEPTEVGRPAAAAAREAIARGSAGFYRGNSLEGVELEVAYQTLPHTDGWSVHFGILSAMLDAPVQRSQYLLAGGGIVSLVLAAILASLVARDIAQRRHDERTRARKKLRASEEHRAMAIEAAALGTWRWNVDRDQIDGCRRARSLLGLSCSSDETGSGWRYRDLIARVHPEDRSVLDALIQECRLNDREIDAEFRVAWPDGTAHWIRVIGRSQRSEPGHPKVLQGVIADVDLRKRADAERTALLRRLAQAQEDERRHIARELHDQVGQTVTGLALGLKGLEQGLTTTSKDEALIDRVRWLRQLTAEIGRDLHQAASNLRPTALDDLGLARALQAYAADWSDRYGLSIDVQTIGNIDRLPAETEIVLYRAVQEGLTNVLKHASASAVSVLLERKGSHLRVILEDNGQGINGSEAAGKTTSASGNGQPRLGLSGIRERLSLIGGTMMIESARGAGTTLYFQAPITPSEPGQSR